MSQPQVCTPVVDISQDIINNMDCGGSATITYLQVYRGWNQKDQLCCLEFCNTSTTNFLSVVFSLSCNQQSQSIHLAPGQCESWFPTGCILSNIGFIISDNYTGVTCRSSYNLNCQ